MARQRSREIAHLNDDDLFGNGPGVPDEIDSEQYGQNPPDYWKYMPNRSRPFSSQGRNMMASARANATGQPTTGAAALVGVAAKNPQQATIEKRPQPTYGGSTVNYPAPAPGAKMDRFIPEPEENNNLYYPQFHTKFTVCCGMWHFVTGACSLAGAVFCLMAFGTFYFGFALGVLYLIQGFLSFLASVKKTKNILMSLAIGSTLCCLGSVAGVIFTDQIVDTDGAYRLDLGWPTDPLFHKRLLGDGLIMGAAVVEILTSYLSWYIVMRSFCCQTATPVNEVLDKRQQRLNSLTRSMSASGYTPPPGYY